MTLGYTVASPSVETNWDLDRSFELPLRSGDVIVLLALSPLGVVLICPLLPVTPPNLAPLTSEKSSRVPSTLLRVGNVRSVNHGRNTRIPALTSGSWCTGTLRSNSDPTQ